MRRGLLVKRRNAHEPDRLEPVFRPALRDEGIRILRQHPRLLRLCTRIYLHEQLWCPAGALDFAR